MLSLELHQTPDLEIVSVTTGYSSTVGLIDKHASISSRISLKTGLARAG